MKPNRTVVHSINFRILPPLDTVLMWEGQRYVVVGSFLHTCQDGSRTPLIRWRSHCAECGEPFECATSLKAKNPNRRCDKHQRPGVAVTARSKQKQRKFLIRSGRRKRNLSSR